MVFYLREITLSIKSDDSVYAKRPLVKTSLLHPCREAPLGALTFRGLKQNSAFRARETLVFFERPVGAYPQSRRGPRDVARLF